MKRILLFAPALALAACGKPNPVADDAKNVDALPTIATDAPDPMGGPPANAVATNAAPAPAGAIPVAVRGRWGLSPRDCTSDLGDAKGLLVVSSSELRFYESRAVPTAKVLTSDDSVGGDFNFTGEGQKWTRNETLELRDHKLIRTERNPVASYTYARCD
jgi:hypothetical protein